MKPCRIFLVEDNPGDVVLLTEAMSENDIRCVVEHYRNGEQAMSALEGLIDMPDLFLLDINMPRIDGLELLKRIRSLPATARVPVGVLTSSQNPSVRSMCEELGADAYLIKPLDYQDFLKLGAVIKDLLDKGKASTAYL